MNASATFEVGAMPVKASGQLCAPGTTVALDLDLARRLQAEGLGCIVDDQPSSDLDQALAANADLQERLDVMGEALRGLEEDNERLDALVGTLRGLGKENEQLKQELEALRAKPVKPAKKASKRKSSSKKNKGAQEGA